MEILQKIDDVIKKNQLKIIWLISIIFLFLIFSLLFIKYQSFGYNALDLGIYNQVFFNSAHGDLFNMSIHPHSYLGDHFELFIILLLPFYLIYQSPLSLILLQIIFVVISVWPLYLIAKEKLRTPWPLIVILIFLFNPFILNLLFFEFHLLPFAIPLLLFSFYFYYKRKFTPFLIFCFLSLLVREDVALVIMMMGVLAWIEKRSFKWILVPMISGVIWFLGAMQLTGYFNQYGNYKFLSMYGLLGNNFSEIIINILKKPWIILKQLFSLNNILSFLAIFITFLGLPLLKPKYFIPILLVAVQLLLLSPNTSILIETHYTSLLLPFIFIALIFALEKINNNSKSNSVYIFINKQKYIIFILFTTTIIYSFITLSPLVPAISQSDIQKQKNNFIKNQISDVNTNDNIISGFNFLPELSGRKNIYSLHYSYLGKQQYSDKDFIIGVPIDAMYVDFNDFTIYYVQTKYNEIKKELYPVGADNINQVIKDNGLVLNNIYDTYAVYKVGTKNNYTLVEFNITPTTIKEQQIDYQLKSIAVEKNTNPVEGTIGLSLYWQTNNKIDEDYFINVIYRDAEQKTIDQKIYPLGYGLYPTSSWPVNENIRTNYWLATPDGIDLNNFTIEVQVLQINNGRLELNGVRTADLKISAYENIGDSLKINYNIL